MTKLLNRYFSDKSWYETSTSRLEDITLNNFETKNLEIFEKEYESRLNTLVDYDLAESY